MREIKFRAWDGRKLKMFTYDHWTRITFCNGSAHIYEGQDEGMWEPGTTSNFILMQFTGLRDSNGKEIYEGDILIESNDGNEFTVVVVWDENHLQWRTREFEVDTCEFYSNCTYTVIGNIHEHPHLMEGGTQ